MESRKSELSVMALEMVKFGVNPDAGMDFWNLADALDLDMQLLLFLQ